MNPLNMKLSPFRWRIRKKLLNQLFKYHYCRNNTIFTYLSLADKYTDKLLYLKQKHRDEQFRN